MDDLGLELRTARESRGMTLEDIHHNTKISIKFLRAIEEGRYNVLPEVYIRFFLKAYASTVGINPAKILKDYNTLRGRVEVEEYQETEQSLPKLSWQEKILSLTDWLKANFRIIGYGFGGILALIVVLVILSNRPEKTVTPDSNKSSITQLSGINLSIKAKSPIYLMVSIDDGDSLDYYLLAGTSQDFLANERIWFLTGSAAATNIIFNGEKSGPFNDDGKAAHFLVDSTGVKIIKSYPPLVESR